MPLWLQHLLVLLLVAGCIAVVAWQLVNTFRGRKSKLGQCCNKGCEASTPTTPPAERTYFIPSDHLARRR
jgi:hypothetical protein